MDFVIRHSYLIPLLPLLGAAVAGFFGARYLKGNSHWPIWIGVGSSAVLSFTLLFGMLGRWHPQHEGGGHGGEARAAVPAAEHAAAASENTAADDESAVQFPETRRDYPTLAFGRHLYTWIRAGSKQVEATDAQGKPVFDASGQPVTKSVADFEINAGFLFDPLTAVMLCVITGIGFLITVFSKGYMAGEEGYFRFFAYLGLLIFMMTILVMGENLVMLYPAGRASASARTCSSATTTTAPRRARRRRRRSWSTGSATSGSAWGSCSASWPLARSATSATSPRPATACWSRRRRPRTT